jgi:hypothetical protein
MNCYKYIVETKLPLSASWLHVPQRLDNKAIHRAYGLSARSLAAMGLGQRNSVPHGGMPADNSVGIAANGIKICFVQLN